MYEVEHMDRIARQLGDLACDLMKDELGSCVSTAGRAQLGTIVLFGCLALLVAGLLLLVSKRF